MPLLPAGKLPPDLLQAVLDKHARHDPRVVVGPRVGEDAAVIDLGDRYLVATADPITFATDELGGRRGVGQRRQDVLAVGRPDRDLGGVLLVGGQRDLDDRVVIGGSRLAEAHGHCAVAFRIGVRPGVSEIVMAVRAV